VEHARTGVVVAQGQAYQLAPPVVYRRTMAIRATSRRSGDPLWAGKPSATASSRRISVSENVCGHG
jgi:hypothetical protein